MYRYRINENVRQLILSGDIGIKVLQKSGWGQIPSEIAHKSFELERSGSQSGLFQYKLHDSECKKIGIKSCLDSDGCWKLKEGWITKDISYKLDLI
jgi:hypothetical protein